MKRRLLRIAAYLMLIVIGLSLNINFSLAASEKAQIAIIPVKGTIEPGLANFIDRSIGKAENLGVKKIILEIDTPGGLIDSAKDIQRRIYDSKVPIVAFVKGEAKSAGVLISFAAQKIYMTPGSSIGAAEPRPDTEKIKASWRSDLEAAAEARGRNEDIAAGMVDKSVVIEGLKKEGTILSLSAKRAVELGMADQIVQNKNALLTVLSQKDGVYYEPLELKPGSGEKLSWWLINPLISPILLLIGFAGLIIELFTLGFGVAGVVGLVALGLFFGGHMMAGITSWLSVAVFALGVIAILIEIFVIPGFGASGIIGIGLIVWSIFLASTSPIQAVISLSVAFIGSIVALYILIKVLGRRGMWERLILGIKLDKETGYIATKKDLEKYLGLEGMTVTPLRPAGTAELAGDRVDVVTEGGFVPVHSLVKVILVEGGRVVVRPIKNNYE